MSLVTSIWKSWRVQAAAYTTELAWIPDLSDCLTDCLFCRCNFCGWQQSTKFSQETEPINVPHEYPLSLSHTLKTHTESVNGSSFLPQGVCVHPTRKTYKEEVPLKSQRSKRHPSQTNMWPNISFKEHRSSSEADIILVVLLFHLQPQQNIHFYVTFSFSLYSSSAVFPHRPWKQELFLK